MAAVKPEVFKYIRELNIKELLKIPDTDLRPLLPCLVRMSLCTSRDSSEEWKENRKYLLQLLSDIEAVNDIVSLLSVDFHELEVDGRKEQQMRLKSMNESSSFQQGILLEYERSEPARKFRIIISELLPVIIKVDAHETCVPCDSELFSSPAYLEDISDAICILCAELPSFLNICTVCIALLHFPNGNWLLTKLVANNSESFLSVSQSLMQINQPKPSTHEITSTASDENLRYEALLLLSSINPIHAMTIRGLCIQHCCLPQLAVALTLNHDHNTADGSISNLTAFVSGLLLGNDSKIRSWFATYIRHAKDSSDDQLRNELIKELKSVVETAEIKTEGNTVKAENGGMETEQSLYPESMILLLEEHCLKAAALIRLYCSLKAIAGVKFTSEESELVLRLMTCFPPLTPSGIRFVSLALGMLLACPALLTGEEQERRVVGWIKWLASRSSEMERIGPEGSSFAEQLLLTAIHLHGDRRTAAVRLACSTLGMRIKVTSQSLTRLRQIFTEEVFPTQVIAAHATKVPVTKQLNANMTGYLPVHCVYQLLKTRAFSQCRVPVQDWIYRQICSTSSPLHPQLQPLVLQFVSTVVTPASKVHRSRQDGALNQPFKYSDILAVYGIMDTKDSEGIHINESKHSLTSMLLMLYYVLLYEDSILSNMKTLASLPNRPQRYPATLINQIPVKLLLFKAQRQPKSCQGLYPALLGLLATHLPHLCLVGDWIDDLDSIFANGPKHGNLKKVKVQPTHKQLLDGLSRSAINPAPALMHLQYLSNSSISADEIVGFVEPLTSGLPFLLDTKVSRRIHQETKKLWLKLNSVIPRKLCVMTINALTHPQTGKVETSKSFLSFDDLVNDPLLPLMVDKRVFHHPELLSIILRIISSCLSASRSQASTLLRAHPTAENKSSTTRSTSPLGVNQSASEAEKEELRSALIATQNSAVVQMLIEICMEGSSPSGDSPNINLLTCKREVHCLVCSQLHQMFIDDPAVAKLVHFQGYNRKMVGVLVAGVPSMHICLDFVPELLQQSNPSQQLFGLELASQLCCHYALPKSLSIARLCVNVISTLTTVIPAAERCGYFTAVLPTLPRLSKSFPPLLPDCVEILEHLGKVTRAYITMHESHLSENFVVLDTDWSLKHEDDFMKNLPAQHCHLVDKHVYLFQKIRATFFTMAKNANEFTSSLA
uniref:integrator complex subunit 2 n=1 Tax=Ciona intestinalis TaxID=7719 RepID=UPI000180B710|nr:integrator complex subunit 2 [Ciona intestinalis]|eukprot:XP_002124952.1 integrator complex subunit 2 [Ciona intestinalis]